MSGRVFVLHDGALGDTLLSLPALALIRQRFKRLHLAAGSDIVNLLLSVGFADEVSSSGSSLFAPLHAGEADERLRRFLEGFDGAYVFSVRGDSAAVKAIKEVVRDTTAVLTLPPDDLKVHVSEFRMQQLQRGGMDTVIASNQHPRKTPQPILQIPASLRETVRCRASHDTAERLIVIHPGSGGQRKCWPLQKYLLLAEKLRELENSRIVLLSGPAEEGTRPLMDEFAAGKKNVSHIRGMDLTHVAALLSCSACYIGNDSGISHLAGAVGAASVVIFGPTDQKLWRPFGRVEVVASPLECAPCGDTRSRSCADRQCLNAISVEVVQEKVATFLRGDAGPR